MENHSTITTANEHEPDRCIKNPFSATRVQNLKILQIMYELISTSATQKCVVFERQYPLEYYTQRAKYITRYLKVFTS